MIILYKEDQMAVRPCMKILERLYSQNAVTSVIRNAAEAVSRRCRKDRVQKLS